MRLPLPRLRSGRIPHEDGRDVVPWVSYWRPLEITTDDASGYRHPWQISLRWAGERDQWEAQIFRDSYVGGPAAREVEAPAMPWRRLPRVTRTRYGDKDPRTPVSPWVSDEPLIPLPAAIWRSLGKDADPVLAGSGETIPQPLLDLGAGTGDELRVDRVEQTFTLSLGGSLAERSRLRLVRALDIVLHVERQRVRLDADTAGELSVVLDLPAATAPYVTAQRARYDPALVPGSILEQFTAALDDTGIDRRLVGRVYLLSRPGAPDRSPIDGTWQPYVDQGLFWNPQHRTTRELNIVEPLRLRFPTGLAGGVGDSLIQATLADINQRDALASLLVSQASVTGQYFT